MIKNALHKLVLDHRARYVVANILITGLTFTRNLVFMRRLGMDDLGQVALAQTIIMFVSFLQIGFINGGYRIYASHVPEENEQVNNLIITFFIFLSIVLLGVAILGGGVAGRLGVKVITNVFGLAAGLATLTTTWMNNCLIADSKLGLSNAFNLTSAGISLLLVLFPKNISLEIALLSLFIQPCLVVVLVLISRKSARPTGILFSIKIAKKILSLGLIPFVAGIIALFNFQLERWSITTVMGPEVLGKFYLVIIYNTIFIMVPASLLNIYFPTAIREFEQGRLLEFHSTLKIHAKNLLWYMFLAIGITIFFMKISIRIFLPKFSGTTHLVYLALPGLIVVTLCDVGSLYYNSVKRLAPLLYYGVVSLGIYAMLLALVRLSHVFSLEAVVISRSIAGIAGGIILFLYYRSDNILQLESK